MTGEDWVSKDFYRVLGVPKDADAAAIKKAYRKLARKYHPDHNPGNPQAEEQFKRVGEAYSVLSDASSRKRYDTIRSMGPLGGMGGGSPFGSSQAGGGIRFEDVFGSMYGGAGPANSANARVRFTSGGAGGFEDVLSGLFGAAAGRAFGAGTRAARLQRGADLAASTRLTFRQAVEGATLKIVVEGRQMTVRVPAGVSEGKKLRLAGRGRPGPAGGPAGDLVVTVHVSEHPVFTLRGSSDLQLTLPVTVAEAVRGAVVEVPLLDGSTAQVKVPPGTSSGTLLRLRGRGIKPAGARKAGDLLARVRIVVPARPSRAVKAAAASFAEASTDFDPRAGLAEKVAS